MNGIRYVLAVIMIVFVVFLAIMLVLRGTTRKSGQTTTGAGNAVQLATLADTGVHVSYTIQGRVVGDDRYRAVRITVDAQERKVEVLNGYQGNVANAQTYTNNPVAFRSFLAALDTARFTTKQTARYSSPAGVCPRGNIYDYSYTTADGKAHELWASSCTKLDGSFAGNTALSEQLFRDQITDYSRATAGVSL